MKLGELLVSYNLVKTPKWKDTSEDMSYEPYNYPTFDDNIARVLSITRPEDSSTVENTYTFEGWAVPEIEEETFKPINFSISAEGLKSFNKLFDEYTKLYGSKLTALDRLLLTDIAALESNFNPKAKNPKGSATGYFLFTQATKDEIGDKDLTMEEFANNPMLLFLYAEKLYNIRNAMLLKYLNKRGLSPLLLMYGMWWRPGSMLNYLKTGSDSYVNEKDGMTLAKILNRAKLYELSKS